jgi:hypothetical protein
MVRVVSPVSRREVEGTQVGFDGIAEPWASYKLSDGSTLRVRPIVTAVHRLDGEYDGAGNPIDTTNSQTVVHGNAPKHLRGVPTCQQPPPSVAGRGGPEMR